FRFDPHTRGLIEARVHAENPVEIVDAGHQLVEGDALDATAGDGDVSGHDWQIAGAGDRGIRVDYAAVSRRPTERTLERLEKHMRRLDVQRAATVGLPGAGHRETFVAVAAGQLRRRDGDSLVRPAEDRSRCAFDQVPRRLTEGNREIVQLDLAAVGSQ